MRRTEGLPSRSIWATFTLMMLHSILDSEGIAIRSGHHCAQILMQKLGVPATSRASFYVYNGYDDVDALIKGLAKVTEVLDLVELGHVQGNYP